MMYKDNSYNNSYDKIKVEIFKKLHIYLTLS